MCAIFGVADASHDELIVRRVLVVSGSGVLMLSKIWLARFRNFLLQSLETEIILLQSEKSHSD
jgi:hypothetical protein